MRNPENWKREIKKCERCDTVFMRPVWAKTRFCSKSCVPAWNKGLKGLGGYKWSEESRKKLSVARTGMKIPNNQGEKNRRWISDRSKLKVQNRRNDSLYKRWRMEVWMRDEFKCVILNESCSGRIEAHHILGWTKYPELRYEKNNGITLCHFHHPRKRVDEIKLIPMLQELIASKNQ